MKKKPDSVPNPETVAQQARSEYGSPMDILFDLPAPDFGEKWPDYVALALPREGAPELQKLACDCRFDESETLWAAPIHAMRVLSTWGDPSFLPPLFQTFAAREDHDLFHEDISKIIAHLGPQALETVKNQLDVVDKEHFPHLADALVKIAQNSRPHRDQIVEIFRDRLEQFAKNDHDWNAFLIGNLIDLAAGELLPLIEKAIRAGKVDTRICGDMEEIRAEFGLAAPRDNFVDFLSIKTDKGVLPPFKSPFKKPPQ
jgi:hypothetical protein